jgi:Leucine-rich repeat (LRR) protein
LAYGDSIQIEKAPPLEKQTVFSGEGIFRGEFSMKPRIGLFLIFYALLFAQQTQWNFMTDSLAVRAILDSSGCPPTVWDDSVTMHHFTVEEVSRSNNGRIRSLFVSGILNDGIKCKTSCLNPSIGHLTELETLDVSRNFFTCFPEELFSLKKLHRLDIGGSNINSIPVGIGNLRSLKDLSVCCCNQFNNILSVLPEEIGNLDSLGFFDLRYNSIRKLPSSIGNLKKLWWLRLQFNQLDSLPPEIGNLAQLIFLDLGYNNITKLPSSMGNLDSLLQLSLDYNKLTVLPSGISHLKLLSRLYLDHNQLRSLPDSIVLLGPLLCTFQGNSLCNQPNPIQAWLDKWAGADWRASQIGCDSNAVKFKTRSVSAEMKQEFRKAIIYDILGRYNGISRDGLVPKNCRPGIYFLHSITSSGNKIKLSVEK